MVVTENTPEKPILVLDYRGSNDSVLPPRSDSSTEPGHTVKRQHALPAIIGDTGTQSKRPEGDRFILNFLPFVVIWIVELLFSNSKS